MFPRVYRAEGTECSLWPRKPAWQGLATGVHPDQRVQAQTECQTRAVLLEEAVHGAEGLVPGRPESQGGELTVRGTRRCLLTWGSWG